MYAVIATDSGVLFLDRKDAEHAATGDTDGENTRMLADAFREIYTPDNDFMQYEIIEIDTTLRARLEALVGELEWIMRDEKRILNGLKLLKQLREILNGEDWQ